MTKSDFDVVNLFNLCKQNMKLEQIPDITPLIEEIEDLKFSTYNHWWAFYQ